MPINKFKFVSPGVQIAEIDNSQLPDLPDASGPVIIGRAERGPALRPVKVNSFSEFVTIFGMPWAGGNSNDVFRAPTNKMSPSYGAYAAQAYLRNSSPITFVRLLGAQNSDAETDIGEAGWKVGGDGSTDAVGGNYALFLLPSSSAQNDQTGTLAAVFYCKEGHVELNGNSPGGATVNGVAGLVQSVGSNHEMKLDVFNAAGSKTETINFNFDKNSDKYIRKVLNTNPTKVNSTVSTDVESYFLGETFDRYVEELGGGSTSGDSYGVIMTLESGSVDHNDRRRSTQPGQAGWVVSQYLGTQGNFDFNNLQKLFKVHGLQSAQWASANLKISISDILQSKVPSSPYGTFTVEVRRTSDNDGNQEIVEVFPRCDLNPNSSNYVARKIGDKFADWNESEARYIEKGEYDNQSQFIRIEMNPDVHAGITNEAFLPFGFYGPPRWKSWSFTSGSTTAIQPGTPATDYTAYAYVEGSASMAVGATKINDQLNPGLGSFVGTDVTAMTGTFKYPTVSFRSDTLTGEIAASTDAYFGVDTSRSGAPTRKEESYIDVVRAFPAGINAYGDSTANSQTASYSEGDPTMFTLDDVRYYSSSAGIKTSQAQWQPGSRNGNAAGNKSINASGSDGSEKFTNVLDAGYNKFTMPLFGGFDGVDITEIDAFGAGALGTNPTVTTNYELNSIKRAIDSCADPEVVDCNIMTVPGNYSPSVTTHVLNTCEARADALAIIDLEGGYVPAENAKITSVGSNYGSVDSTISNLRQRVINSSYGCAYYPWVQVRDEESNQLFWAPPSIPAIGTLSSAQRNSELWFAPAGFTRGGLTEGAAGLPVVGVVEKLTSKQRDDLYEVNINPIASFPAEGIVIFGQKTLQTTPSALDRVNVRRLMIHVKKGISRIASTLLFDQNVQTTWDRFSLQANTFLESIKQRLGLEDYKVILDETTTTPDLVDRNTLYAKVYLKPARAIEFIAVDFVITNSGASFED